jgi:S1-C subfamily serine protease
MFNPSNITLTTFFGATHEEVMKEAALYLQQLVALVKVKNQDDSVNHGTCLFFNNRFFMLTCYHYLKDSKEITVKFVGSDKAFPAEISHFDAQDDLAVLKVSVPGYESHNLPYFQYASSMNQGAMSFCAGFSHEQTYQVTSGMISIFEKPSKGRGESRGDE